MLVRRMLHYGGGMGRTLYVVCTVSSIRLKSKNSWYATRGQQVQKLGPWDLWQASN